MNSNDWVAEHIMGFERGYCHGIGGSRLRAFDQQDDYGYWCRWCHRDMVGRSYKSTDPCPKYPFPKFTLVDLMRKLGERGHYGRICYTAAHHYDFTIALGGYHIYANDPLQALCDHLLSEAQSLGSQANVFANIRDAIKLLQKALGQVEGK